MSYTTKDVLLTTRQVELIGKKEFEVIALDLKYKIFIVHVIILNLNSGDNVHPSKKA